MAVFHSGSAQQTREIGRALGERLRPGDVVALCGGLGAGKTAFVSGLAQGMGITQPVSSPTFALVNSYAGEIPLHHFDMYRIDGWDDLYSTGFFDYLEQSAVIAVEWSENIEAALPPGHYTVQLRQPAEDENCREIIIDGDTNRD